MYFLWKIKIFVKLFFCQLLLETEGNMARNNLEREMTEVMLKWALVTKNVLNILKIKRKNCFSMISTKWDRL